MIVCRVVQDLGRPRVVQDLGRPSKRTATGVYSTTMSTDATTSTADLCRAQRKDGTELKAKRMA